MRISTYLNFNGQCEAAFNFYAQVLNGSIETMMTNANTPQADCPTDFGDKILHAQLRIGDRVLMGSDAPPAYFEAAQGFNVSINVDSVAEADRVFNALSEGGVIKMPIGQTFWSRRFGMLVDRFGTPWLVNCDLPPE